MISMINSSEGSEKRSSTVSKQNFHFMKTMKNATKKERRALGKIGLPKGFSDMTDKQKQAVVGEMSNQHPRSMARSYRDFKKSIAGSDAELNADYEAYFEFTGVELPIVQQESIIALPTLGKLRVRIKK